MGAIQCIHSSNQMPRAPIAGGRGTTTPRAALGYCCHGKVAWRVKGAELAVAAGVTREEHRAMLEYVNDMESVTRPTKSRDAYAASAER